MGQETQGRNALGVLAFGHVGDHKADTPHLTTIPSQRAARSSRSRRSWLRRRLRALDLMDAKAKKPVMSKVEYKARARRVMNTARSKTVAGNIVGGFRKTCREIHALGGGAARRG